MGKVKKKYWIKYTPNTSPAGKKTTIKWFDFLENRDLFLKGIIRARNFKDIQFGKRYIGRHKQ